MLENLNKMYINSNINVQEDLDMITITSTELRNNFGKYMEKAQEEEIEVKRRGITIFRMVPEKNALLEEAKSFIGILPSDATIGEDPDERD